MGNPIVHWELMVSDLDKAREFYTNVFDWEVEGLPAFPGYPMIDPGKEPRGAMMVKPEAAPGLRAQHLLRRGQTSRQTLARAVGAGGTMLVPADAHRGRGRVGHVRRSRTASRSACSTRSSGPAPRPAGSRPAISSSPAQMRPSARSCLTSASTLAAWPLALTAL